MKNKLIRQLLMILSGLFVINLFATTVDEFKEKKRPANWLIWRKTPHLKKLFQLMMSGRVKKLGRFPGMLASAAVRQRP